MKKQFFVLLTLGTMLFPPTISALPPVWAGWVALTTMLMGYPGIPIMFYAKNKRFYRQMVDEFEKAEYISVPHMSSLPKTHLEKKECTAHDTTAGSSGYPNWNFETQKDNEEKYTYHYKVLEHGNGDTYLVIKGRLKDRYKNTQNSHKVIYCRYPIALNPDRDPTINNLNRSPGKDVVESEQKEETKQETQGTLSR